MSHSIRRRVDIRASWRRAREQFADLRGQLHEMHFRHLCELADLRKELDETRAAFNELRAAVLCRQTAERELAGLYRARDIERARAAERDPALPLN
jgi:hypothetical protein